MNFIFIMIVFFSFLCYFFFLFPSFPSSPTSSPFPIHFIFCLTVFETVAVSVVVLEFDGTQEKIGYVRRRGVSQLFNLLFCSLTSLEQFFVNAIKDALGLQMAIARNV